MKYTKEISKKLNDLLTKNYDAEAGYKLAKDKVNNSVIKDFLINQAKERYNFGHELKEEIRSYGEIPEKGTSIKGDAHRTWMNLKSTFTSNNEEAILEEAIRGERTAIEEYNSVISETTLPPSTKSILIKHRDVILNSLTRITEMEEIA